MGYKLNFNNDITMCATYDCPLEAHCLRKNAMQNKNQSMAEFQPEPDDTGVVKCDGFIYNVIA